MGNKLSTLELCAGAGGAALGLEKAGFNPLALVDIEKNCCATLKQNRPQWHVIEADIKRLDVSCWKGVDLVSGGLPCPPFSIAGHRLGPADERNLFPAMLNIVKSVRPRAVLIENVKGLMGRQFETYRKNIQKRLNRLGFDVYWSLFNAADFGVPQTRWRAFMIALRKGETKDLEWPIGLNTPPNTVGDVLYDLMAENGWRYVDKWASQANQIAPTIVGGSHKHGGPDLGPTRARLQWRALNVDGLGLADAAPPPSFRGMPRLTVDMIKCLQSFPDDWQITGKKTAAYRQIGNALPVKLAQAVAKAVRKCLL